MIEVERFVEADVVDFWEFVFGMGKFLSPFALIGHDEEPLGIDIEASDVKKAGKFFRKEFKNCFFHPLAYGRTNHALGFVEHEDKRFLLLQQLAANDN